MIKHYSKYIFNYTKDLLLTVCLLITLSNVYSQSFGILSVDSSTTAHHNPSDDSTFFARVTSDPGNSSGYFDSLQRTVITCEAETLKLTSSLITQLSGSSGQAIRSTVEHYKLENM